MAEILEIIVTFLAIAIYGSEDRPRHSIWRNTVRVIAFGGAALSAANMLGLLGNIQIPLGITILWAICSMIIISAEYYVGSKKVCYVALITSAIWILIVFITSDILR